MFFLPQIWSASVSNHVSSKDQLICPPPPLLKISLMLNSILSTSPIIKSYVSHHISTSTTERRFRFLIQIIRDSFQSGWKKKKNFLVIGNNDTSIFIIIIVQLKKLKIFRLKRKILWTNIISFYYSTDYTEFWHES